MPAAHSTRSRASQMNWVDIVIISALLGVAFLGSRIGVIRAACVFGAFILATIVAARASVILAARLGELVYDRELGYLVSFGAAFTLTFVGLLFIGDAICRITEFPPLRWIDRGLGAVLGLLAGVVFIGIAIVYLTKTPVSNSEQWLGGSSLVPMVRAIISPLFREFLEKDDMVASVVFNRMM